MLREIISSKNDKLIDIFNYTKGIRLFFKCIYNLWNNVNNFSIRCFERRLSRLKITKTYLRSTISQERLNKLDLLSIEKKR